MNSQTIRIGITGVAAIVVSLGVLVSLDIDGTFAGVIALIFTLLVIAVEEIIYGRIMAKINDKESEHVIIDAENETAMLKKRSKTSASFFSYEPVRYMNYKNHDAKLVYTGATVGGIHTGGFHTTEAYTSESAGPSSGNVHVFVRYEDGSTTEIKKIKLTPELLEKAKKDKKLSKFIEEDCICLRKKDKETKLTESEQAVLSTAINTHNTALQYEITQRAFVAQFLKASDVKYITEWIYGEEAKNPNRAWIDFFDRYKKAMIGGLAIIVILLLLLIICFASS